MSLYYFTSESVSEGHPDKICDRISDEILDLFLAHDPYARVAVESLATTQQLTLAGEVRSNVAITHEEIIECARQAVHDIGYEQDGFHWQKMNVDCFIHGQSSHIAQGVDNNSLEEEGAGDQGIMFGYATDETELLMPPAILYAHQILEILRDERKKQGINSFLGPDAKSQVTLTYEHGKAIGCDAIVVSTQHIEGCKQQDLHDFLLPIIERVLPDGWMPPLHKVFINPTGNFVIGGPDGDCGLTGRKIIVDTYGGAAPHGGGAFSGKDPSKVDRSAAYMARYCAKNIVKAGLASRCTIQLSYAIGVAKPTSVFVNCHGTATIDERIIEKALQDIVDLRPGGIRKTLDLHRPIYAPTSSYGHFGRIANNGLFPWEKTDLASMLLAAL